MFEVSTDGVPSNLKFEFMDLYQQYGASSVSYDEVKWLSLPMSDYGVTEITATALSDFRKRLEDDDDMTREYLVRKLGFNAQDETETNMAYDVLKDKDLLSEKKLKTGEYICQMHKSTSGS